MNLYSLQSKESAATRGDRFEDSVQPSSPLLLSCLPTHLFQSVQHFARGGAGREQAGHVQDNRNVGVPLLDLGQLVLEVASVEAKGESTGELEERPVGRLNRRPFSIPCELKDSQFFDELNRNLQGFAEFVNLKAFADIFHR